MKRNKKSYYALAAATALLLTNVNVANADDLLDNDPAKGSVPADITSHSAFVFPAGGGSPIKTRASNWSLTGALQGSATRAISPAGTAANISSGFTSNLAVSNTNSVCTVSGNSSAMWFGSKPYNATSVMLTDTLWANSLSPTGVSAGAGWSASFGLTTATTSFSNEVSNTWKNTHDYSGIQFSGLLINVNQNSLGSFRFGSATYNITAN
jgi:hypothetical protein